MTSTFHSYIIVWAHFFFFKTTKLESDNIFCKQRLVWYRCFCADSGLYIICGPIRRAGSLLQTCSLSSENPNLLNPSPAQVTQLPTFHPPHYKSLSWNLHLMNECFPTEGSGSGNLSTSSSCSETYTSFSDIKAWSRCSSAYTVHFLLKLLESLYCI